MRLALLILLLSGCASFPRRHEVIDGHPLTEIVGFACFFEGKPTPLVQKTDRYVRTKQYKKIAAFLSSPIPGRRYLAALTLPRLAALGKYTLTDQQRTSIAALRTSKESVPVCFGCIAGGTIELGTLLTDENYQLLSGLWLDRIAGKLSTGSDRSQRP